MAGASPNLKYMPGRQGGATRLSKEQIIASVDSSLKRLGTDYIDLIQVKSDWIIRTKKIGNTFIFWKEKKSYSFSYLIILSCSLFLRAINIIIITIIIIIIIIISIVTLAWSLCAYVWAGWI